MSLYSSLLPLAVIYLTRGISFEEGAVFASFVPASGTLTRELLCRRPVALLEAGIWLRPCSE